MQGGDSLDGERRLRPGMASLRLLVLDFVRQYWARWGGSPSYGEIAGGLATNRVRVQRAVRLLVQRGELLRVPGPRGLFLPGSEAGALQVLRALGWTVEGEGRGVTQSSLPAPPLLDYCPGHDQSGDEETGSSSLS